MRSSACAGWTHDADPLIAELEGLAQQKQDNALLVALEQRSGVALARLDRVAAAGPVLAGRVYVLPDGGPPHAIPPAVLVQHVPT